jgi:NADH-quinone oxidoreductase subunit N
MYRCKQYFIKFLVFLLFINFLIFVITLLYFYMIFYNLTLLGFFWVTNSNIIITLKTLYSLNLFSFNSFYIFFLTIFLFSLAGVPPFTGFLNKLFIFDILAQDGFFTLYSFLIILLLVGLYFYMQNLRFLHSTNHNYIYKPFMVNDRVSINLHYYLIILGILILNGVFLMDDFLLSVFWLFC